MECPKCGAMLPPSDSECVCCTTHTVGSPSLSLDATVEPIAPPKPFAQITPYSGPYPPTYVQISSSESRPGPTNLLAKWIGMLWSVAIPICIALDTSSVTADRTGAPLGASGERVGIGVWIGLWVIVALPAYWIHRHTRPQR
jgi:hypothetical protein